MMKRGRKKRRHEAGRSSAAPVHDRVGGVITKEGTAVPCPLRVGWRGRGYWGVRVMSSKAME